jgi:hypothetical protein
MVNADCDGVLGRSLALRSKSKLPSGVEIRRAIRPDPI